MSGVSREESAPVPNQSGLAGLGSLTDTPYIGSYLPGSTLSGVRLRAVNAESLGFSVALPIQRHPFATFHTELI